jgi:uncharacterized protein HemY
MLAEMLSLAQNHTEALAEYEVVLRVAPNRFNALYGAATAAEASGNVFAANRYYQLLTQTALGDEREEVVSARKKLSVTAQKSSSQP